MPSFANASALGVDIRKEIADALYLLDYAVANGVKTADKLPLPHDVAVVIKVTADKISAEDATISAEDWAAFEAAYYDLAVIMAPVTVETLRNTETKRYVDRSMWEHVFGDCAAIRFTRGLWVLTIVFAAFVLFSGWYLMMQAEVAATGSYAGRRIFFERSTAIKCWEGELVGKKPGDVIIAKDGSFEGRKIGLIGGQNHAKVGVTTSGPSNDVIFGDLNQQGTIAPVNGKCDSSQNGRGGLFFILHNDSLHATLSAMLDGDDEPFKAR